MIVSASLNSMYRFKLTDNNYRNGNFYEGNNFFNTLVDKNGFLVPKAYFNEAYQTDGFFIKGTEINGVTLSKSFSADDPQALLYQEGLQYDLLSADLIPTEQIIDNKNWTIDNTDPTVTKANHLPQVGRKMLVGENYYQITRVYGVFAFQVTAMSPTGYGMFEGVIERRLWNDNQT